MSPFGARVAPVRPRPAVRSEMRRFLLGRQVRFPAPLATVTLRGFGIATIARRAVASFPPVGDEYRSVRQVYYGITAADKK